MLESVDVGTRGLDSYRGVAPDHLLDDLLQGVRERFLLPRLVLNHLQLMRQLVDREPLARDPDWSRRHDPVCGMALGEQPEATANHRGVEYGFCSERCRFRFLDTPERYAQEP